MSAVRVGLFGLSVLALAACASGPRGGPGGPGGPDGPGGPGGPDRIGGMLSESMIARPIGLLFVGFDTDHDYATSMAELDAGLKAEFTRADANADGFISGFEMVDWITVTMGHAEAQPDYRTMNSDLGQSVSPKEFDIAFRREFTTMDRNGDGRLTRAELLIAAPRMGGFGGGGGQRGGGGGESGGGGGRRGGGGGSGGGGPPGGGGGGPY